jgi:hypothetical protein
VGPLLGFGPRRRFRRRHDLAPGYRP